MGSHRPHGRPRLSALTLTPWSVDTYGENASEVRTPQAVWPGSSGGGNTETAGRAVTDEKALGRVLVSVAQLSRPPSFLFDPSTLNEYLRAVERTALAFARDEEITTTHLGGRQSRERISTLLARDFDFESAAARLFGDRSCCQKASQAYETY